MYLSRYFRYNATVDFKLKCRLENHFEKDLFRYPLYVRRIVVVFTRAHRDFEAGEMLKKALPGTHKTRNCKSAFNSRKASDSSFRRERKKSLSARTLRVPGLPIRSRKSLVNLTRSIRRDSHSY